MYLRVASVWMRGEKNRLIVLYECVCITIIHSLWNYVYCKKKYILRVVSFEIIPPPRYIYQAHTRCVYIYHTGCAECVQLTVQTNQSFLKNKTLSLLIFNTFTRVDESFVSLSNVNSHFWFLFRRYKVLLRFLSEYNNAVSTRKVLLTPCEWMLWTRVFNV